MRFPAAIIAASVLLSHPVLAVEAGQAAPSAAAPRLGEAQPLVAIADLRGQVVYVDFWASWCVPCRTSMPALDALYRKHRDRGFVVVGVNKDVEAGDAQRFLARVPVSFPLLADTADRVARAFQVKAMPSGYLIDRGGTVRQVHRGFTALTAASLEEEVERLLKESR